MSFRVELSASNLASPTLGADLLTKLATTSPPVAAVDEGDAQALAMQGAALADMHAFRGPGTVRVTKRDDGAAFVDVLQDKPAASAQQPLDAGKLGAMAAARLRAATAKRKIVLTAKDIVKRPASAKPGARRDVPPAPPKPGKKVIAGARTRPPAPAPGTSPASRPTRPSAVLPGRAPSAPAK
jgi:hypothetical protein